MGSDQSAADVFVRMTREEDIAQITQMCGQVYRHTLPWTAEELRAHQRVFGPGQMVAVERGTGRVVGMCASLVVHWDDYDLDDTWEHFTGRGKFQTHDPTGRTLYGADVMVDPSVQGQGVGKKLYAARRNLVKRLGLLRIRAGARLRGYSRYADELKPAQYVAKVIAGELGDPTLSFQLGQGFRVLAVVAHYLREDPESLGYAAVIEWLNPEMLRPGQETGHERFRRRYAGELGD